MTFGAGVALSLAHLSFMRSFYITILTIGLVWACENSSGPGYTLAVSPDSIQLLRNDTVRLSVTTFDQNGQAVTGVPVTFASADTTIATVSTFGLIRAKSAVGRTTIRVSAGAEMIDVPVRVAGIPSSIAIRPTDTTVGTSTLVQYRAVVLDEIGDPISDIAISWISSDTSVATVSAAGRATPKPKAGVTYISAQIDSLVEYARLTVAFPRIATSVTVTPTDTVITPGTTLQLRATVRDGFGDSLAKDIIWYSADTALVTVSSEGLVHSKGPNGLAVISAYVFGSSARGDASIRIATPGVATQIAIGPVDTVISSGASVQFRATARDAFGDSVAASIIWSSDDSTIATVSSSGLAHGEGPVGSTYIRAGDGTISGSTFLTVQDTLLAGRSPLSKAWEAAISSENAAYVVNEFGLSRADLPARGFRPNLRLFHSPMDVAFNSTGTRAYVTNRGNGTVSVIDVATNTAVDSFPVGQDPYELTVAPGDSILWVGKLDSVYAIRLEINVIVARFQIGGIANGMAIARDTLLYVSNGNKVVEFNLRTRRMARTLATGPSPQKLAVSENGLELYIANQRGYIEFWDLSTGRVSAFVTLPAPAFGIALRPSNGLLYATSNYVGTGIGSLYIIDPLTRTLIQSTVLGRDAGEVIFTADGSIGLIPNEGGWVDFIK